MEINGWKTHEGGETLCYTIEQNTLWNFSGKVISYDFPFSFGTGEFYAIIGIRLLLTSVSSLPLFFFVLCRDDSELFLGKSIPIPFSEIQRKTNKTRHR